MIDGSRDAGTEGQTDVEVEIVIWKFDQIFQYLVVESISLQKMLSNQCKVILHGRIGYLGSRLSTHNR